MPDWKELSVAELPNLLALSLVALSIGFAFGMAALIRVAPRLVDRLVPEKAKTGDTARIGPSRTEFSELTGRVGHVETLARRVERELEDHMRQSAAQTEELTKVRVKVAEVAANTEATRNQVTGLDDRLQRIDDKLERITDRMFGPRTGEQRA